MQEKAILPDTGFVRLSDVLRVLPYGRSTWWAGCKSGRFPAPVKLGVRTTGWRVQDIKRLIAQLGSPAAGDPCQKGSPDANPSNT